MPSLIRPGRLMQQAMLDPDPGVYYPGKAGSNVTAYYDPLDLTSLDASSSGVGTIPSVGGPVGFIYDKISMGRKTVAAFIAAQPQKMTNGDFASSDISAWTTGVGGANVALSWVSGAMRVAATGAVSGGWSFQLTLNSGVYHKIKFTIANAVVAGTAYRVSWGTTNNNAAGIGLATAGNGNFEFTLRATAGTMFFNVGFTTPVIADTFDIDNISIKEVPGAHLSQATAAQQPLLTNPTGSQYELTFDGVNDFLQPPTAGVVATSNAGFAGAVRRATAGIVSAGFGFSSLGNPGCPYWAATNIIRFGTNTSTNANTVAAYTDTGAMVLSMYRDAANAYFFKNESPLETVANANNTGSSFDQFGRNSSGIYHNGAWGRFGMMSNPSAAARGNFSRWCGTSMGLSF